VLVAVHQLGRPFGGARVRQDQHPAACDVVDPTVEERSHLDVELEFLAHLSAQRGLRRHIACIESSARQLPLVAVVAQHHHPAVPGDHPLDRHRPTIIDPGLDVDGEISARKHASTASEHLLGRPVAVDRVGFQLAELGELVPHRRRRRSAGVVDLDGTDVNGARTSSDPGERSLPLDAQHQVAHDDAAGRQSCDDSVDEPRTDDPVPNDRIAGLGVPRGRVGHHVHHGGVLRVRVREMGRDEARADLSVEPVGFEVHAHLGFGGERDRDRGLSRARWPGHDHDLSRCEHASPPRLNVDGPQTLRGRVASVNN